MTVTIFQDIFKRFHFYRHINLPPFPQGLQIMADQGFANKTPLLLPLSMQGNQMRGMMEM